MSVPVISHDMGQTDPVVALKVIDALITNEAATAQEVSQLVGLPIKQVMGIMAHPEFLKRFHKLKKNVAKAEFDTVAYDRLIQIIRKVDTVEEIVAQNGKSSADKNAIAAAKALSDILGVSERKAGTNVNVNLSFDAIIREAEEKGIDAEIIFPGFESE